MPELSSALLRQLRRALLQCDEFNSDNDLRAAFVTSDLSPFHDAIPEANSKGERVNLCLEYSLRHYDGDGWPVLIPLLNALADRYEPGDARCPSLIALSSALLDVLRPTLGLQRVMVTLDRVGQDQDVPAKTLNNLRTLYQFVGEETPQSIADLVRWFRAVDESYDTANVSIDQDDVQLRPNTKGKTMISTTGDLIMSTNEHLKSPGRDLSQDCPALGL